MGQGNRSRVFRPAFLILTNHAAPPTTFAATVDCDCPGAVASGAKPEPGPFLGRVPSAPSRGEPAFAPVLQASGGLAVHQSERSAQRPFADGPLSTEGPGPCFASRGTRATTPGAGRRTTPPPLGEMRGRAHRTPRAARRPLSACACANGPHPRCLEDRHEGRSLSARGEDLP